MRIQDMFERDITRNINGVIKVTQEDDASIEQELSEYVVTRELSRHFSDFLNAYGSAIDVPTDKIGVWISGFFGSGKSHFLKMLSYLLSNKTVNGKTAVEYLAPRLGEHNPMLESEAIRCASIPTEAILFNIDSKAPSTKDDTVIMRVFARVFYENQGFYGQDLKLARLERFIDGKGKTEEFRAAYEGITGVAWVEDRENYEFNAEDVAEALANAGVMTGDTALNWINGEETKDFSIEGLVDDINEYCECRAAENGGQFRLLFMVDEIGQYIGDNTSLMLNLQTLVEDLGAKCRGRVWVMVTSQEAIDEVTTVAGNDFSKIQGRFNTRLSLSSTDADEVIKRRILAKTPDAENLLRTQYDANMAVIKNLYTFKDAMADLRGYKGADDYAASFPFANYQFRLLQNVMEELRKQGNSGKHTSNGERSMLSGFQETAQHIKDRDENALAPFWMFYDTLQSFLEGYHRRVINRAAVAAADPESGLEPYDVNVLKLLFLIRWVDREMPGNIENIVTLMTDDLNVNRADLRRRVQESLDRLKQQNYAAQNGEVYQFLTDDEQEISKQIKKQKVDPSRMTAKVADLIFADIMGTDKLSVGKNQFFIDQIIDQTTYRSHGGLTLRVVAGIDGSPLFTEQQCIMSSSNDEAIVVLSDEYDFYGQLMEAIQIDLYTHTVQLNNLPENQQKIIQDKQRQRTALETRGKAMLSEAIVHGTCYSQGATFTPANSTSAKKILEEVAQQQVSTVYAKLNYIDKNYDDDAQLKSLLKGVDTTPGTYHPNTRALEEVLRQIDLDQSRHLAVTMETIQKKFQGKPYGWREIDIAAVMAELMAAHKVKVTVSGQMLEPASTGCVEYLRRASKTKLASVELRRTTTPAVVNNARQILVDVLDNQTLPMDEEGLAAEGFKQLGELKARLTSLINTEYARMGAYPGRKLAEELQRCVGDALAAGSDPADFLGRVVKLGDDLQDAAEDFEDVDEFFAGPQREVFDDARAFTAKMSPERGYLSEQAATDLSRMGEIVAHDAPFRQLNQLTALKANVQAEYSERLQDKRAEMVTLVEEVFARIEGHAAEKDTSISEIGRKHTEIKNVAHTADTMTALDALPQRLSTVESQLIDRIDAAYAERTKPAPATTDVTTVRRAPEQPAAPKVKVASVASMSLFPPSTVRTEQDIDAYLAKVRERMLNKLQGNDELKFK